MSHDTSNELTDVTSFNEPLASVAGLIELDDASLANVVGGATCTDNEGSCGKLTGCTINTGSCPSLATCDGNATPQK